MYQQVNCLSMQFRTLPGRLCWYKFNPSIAHQSLCSSEAFSGRTAWRDLGMT